MADKPRFRGHPSRGWYIVPRTGSQAHHIKYHGKGIGYRYVTLEAAYEGWLEQTTERGTRSPGKRYATLTSQRAS